MELLPGADEEAALVFEALALLVLLKSGLVAVEAED